jgi:malonate transporter and related proteins
MLDLIAQFAPFFALVLMGWGATRWGWLPLAGIGALNTFVLFFGLPAMVFRLAASGALQQRGLLGLLAVYGLAGSLVVGLALAWTLRSRAGVRLRRRDGGMLALVTVFPNTGFLGLPLLTGLLGPQAAGPVAATLLIDVLLLSSLCLAWAHSSAAPGQAGSGASDHPGAAAWQSLRGALRNPLLWSMAAGLVVSWAGWSLSRPVDETLRLLSLSATPTALFTLGAILARSGSAMRQGLELPAQGTGQSPKLGVLVPVLLKLLVHPALVWCGGLALLDSGWDLPLPGLITLTLAAALPSASNVSMLAEREGADTGLVAKVILWSTALAWLSVAAWAHGLGVR